MSLTVSSLRKKSNFSKLRDAVSKTAKKDKDYTDNRLWKPTKTKDGTAQAVVRFLPQANTEDLDFVKLYSHAFDVNGKWLIENCPTTIGLPCPICEENGKLWSEGTDAAKDIVRKRKRKTSYVANIYVESDKGNPENEGKVFLWKFGAKIYAKLEAAINPEFEDQDALNPFDLFEGASFKVRVKQVDGYDNYDSSEFAKASDFLQGDEEQINDVLSQVYDLSEFTSKENFKTYEELLARLKSVLGGKSSVGTAEDEDLSELEDEVVEQKQSTKTTKPKEEKVLQTKKVEPAVSEDDDFEDFSSLVD